MKIIITLFVAFFYYSLSFSSELLILSQNQSDTFKKLHVLFSNIDDFCEKEGNQNLKICSADKYKLKYIIAPRIKAGYFLQSSPQDIIQGPAANLFIGSFLKDVLGIKMGIVVSNKLELGLDMGTSIFINNIGPYVNYYPFEFNQKLKKFYVSTKAYRTVALNIGGDPNTKTYQAETNLGYSFSLQEKKLKGFLELGMNFTSSKLRQGDEIIQNPGVLFLPVLSFGTAYRF